MFIFIRRRFAYGDDLVGSDSENSGDEHDAYMERMKREGKRTRDPNDSDKTDSDGRWNVNEATTKKQDFTLLNLAEYFETPFTHL